MALAAPSPRTLPPASDRILSRPGPLREPGPPAPALFRRRRFPPGSGGSCGSPRPLRRPMERSPAGPASMRARLGPVPTRSAAPACRFADSGPRVPIAGAPDPLEIERGEEWLRPRSSATVPTSGSVRVRCSGPVLPPPTGASGQRGAAPPAIPLPPKNAKGSPSPRFPGNFRLDSMARPRAGHGSSRAPMRERPQPVKSPRTRSKAFPKPFRNARAPGTGGARRGPLPRRRRDPRRNPPR